MTDFKRIRDWDLSSHLAEHRQDLDWLNGQVQRIEREEPGRDIAVFTYVHAPWKSTVVLVV